MALIPKIGRKKLKLRLIVIAITIFLWIGVALHLWPFYWMVMTSLKDTREMFQIPGTLWVKRPSFYIYKAIGATFLGSSGGSMQHLLATTPANAIKNSIILTFGCMALSIPSAALAAYALSKLVRNAKWNRLIFLYIVATMFVPGVVSLIPSYLIMQNFPFFSRNIPKIPFTDKVFPHINFLGTYWAIILPAIGGGAFNVLLFKGFFDGIPNEILNAARIDGASELSIFGRIVLPISKPVFAVVAWMSFGGTWNNFMGPLIFLKGKTKLYPLCLVMYQFMHELQENPFADPAEKNIGIHYIGGYPLMMAVALIEAIPLFIMFIIFREQLMKGVKIRGFK